MLVIQGAAASQALPPSSLEVAVMGGRTDIVFDLRNPTVIEIAVQVKDSQGRPRRRAMVILVVGGGAGGAGALFLNHNATIQIYTDENGIAKTTVQPDGSSGSYTIKITARDGELFGETTIQARNITTPGPLPKPAGKAGLKWLVVGGAIAGGAVAACLLAGCGSKPPDIRPPVRGVIAAGGAGIQ